MMIKLDRKFYIDMENEIERLVVKEIMTRGTTGDEVCTVVIAMDEDQKDTFESYKCAEHFNPLQYHIEYGGYDDELEWHYYYISWSETDFIDLDDPDTQAFILEMDRCTRSEIKAHIKHQDFIIYTYDEYEGAPGANSSIVEIGNLKFIVDYIL